MGGLTESNEERESGSVMAERKERERSREVWRRERKWEELSPDLNPAWIQKQAKG